MLGYVTDPAAPSGIIRRELPEPQTGEHDVVVEVAAYAVNRGELALIEGRADGWNPGQDVAGVIIAAAADGTGHPAGTRVVGIADQGGWSERVAIPSHRVAALPDSVSFTEAAPQAHRGFRAIGVRVSPGNAVSPRASTALTARGGADG
jgi:NADPH:quinone reductase-like Zn-dependent oxidoreductase